MDHRMRFWWHQLLAKLMAIYFLVGFNCFISPFFCLGLGNNASDNYSEIPTEAPTETLQEQMTRYLIYLFIFIS